ncbi:MAG: thiamine pyrophosphate-binding protein [Elusimicrobiales bacterium]
MRVADFVAGKLVERGVERVFMIVGGGAMHLNDALGKCKGIAPVFFHNEQGCAIAAEGYSRMTGRLGVVNVTTGPGGLNTLTGVMGQWTDSVPVLYISGQVKFETTIHYRPEVPVRQIGDQEVDIIKVVGPVTKFAVSVTNPQDIGYYLDKAINIAVTGRPGPVWVDIPMNVQGAQIDENSLRRYDPAEDKFIFDEAAARSAIAKTAELLKNAKRPVVVGGNGVRAAHARDKYLALVKRLGAPVCCTFNAADMVPNAHPLFAGRIGTVGDRAGNFALQNADVALFIGTRNNIRQVSYGWKTFARHAHKIVVDADAAELQKHTLTPDTAVHCDAGFFIDALAGTFGDTVLPDWKEWVDWCAERKRKYPVVLPEYRRSEKINPYVFIEELTRQTSAGHAIVTGDGTACVAPFQAADIKEGQRVFWNSGCATMGYDLPAAIGACIASGGKDTVCLAGDGSVMMNVQEMQTIAYYRLPVKIFILNNNGYVSIKQTQAGFFGMPYVGCGPESGVGFPDFQKLAAGFGIPALEIAQPARLAEGIKAALAAPGPVLCEVKLAEDYIFSPKLSSERKPDGRMVSKPIEDMYPFLDRGEFQKNMLVPLWPEE